jgi:O-antigen/teichoic acid export membrane protein
VPSIQRGTGGRRVLWVVVDQAVSSVGNFGLGLVVARSSSASEFGAFGIVFSLYLILVAASRAVCSEPLLVRHSDATPDELASGVKESTGAALVVGLVASVGCALVAPFLPSPTQGAVLALAVVLPGLLLQDAWRHAFFVQARPGRAVANDGLWTVTSLCLVLWLGRSEQSSLGLLVLAWGAAGSLAGLLGAAQAGLRPRPRATASWWRKHRDLAARFLGEVAVTTGTTNTALVLIGVTGGLQVVGALRGAEVLLGPMRVLALATPAAVIPELVRLRNRRPDTLRSRCALVSVGLASVTVLWSVALHLVPDDAGRAVLGQSWSGARAVLGIVTLDTAAIGVAIGAAVGLRALAAARRSLRARLTQAPLTLTVPVAGAQAGASGGAWGYAGVSVVGAVIWWYHLRAADAEARTHPGRTQGGRLVDDPSVA